jgi:hypothetical protein
MGAQFIGVFCPSISVDPLFLRALATKWDPLIAVPSGEQGSGAGADVHLTV